MKNEVIFNKSEEICKIKLTQDKYTIIDFDDYGLISNYKWYAHKKGNSFYVNSKIKSKTIFLHRVILDPPENMHVDHINGDGLDNRRCNIRIVVHHQNMMNRNKRKDNISKYKGVYKRKDCNRYAARIVFNGKTIHLGNFLTDYDAARAYNEAAKKYFGEYSRLNLIEVNP